MPAQSMRSTISTPTPAVPLNGHYPKLLSGDSGSVWLVTAANTGVIVHLSAKPQKAKHRLGYYTTRLVEKKMRAFAGTVTIAV